MSGGVAQIDFVQTEEAHYLEAIKILECASRRGSVFVKASVAIFDICACTAHTWLNKWTEFS